MSAPMTVLPIITLPDPLLRKSSAPIERIDADVRKLAADMLETMYAAPGVGLAAVQVGVPRRRSCSTRPRTRSRRSRWC